MTTVSPQNPFVAQATDQATPVPSESTDKERPPAASFVVAENSTGPDPTSCTNNPVPASTPVTSRRNSDAFQPSKLPVTTPLTPRKKNLGLSELSKQLRALQAKNEGQAVEIDRLERQLRILADLQGISVSDLRKALSDACQSEAYGELQSRVAALRAQLEAAAASKQTVEQDSAAHHIANLQLRVGELEEVEHTLRSQVNGLFESLKQQTAKASRFESTCKQQQSEMDRLREALHTAQQQQQASLVPAPDPVVQVTPEQHAMVPISPTLSARVTPSQQQTTPLVPASVDQTAQHPQQRQKTTSLVPVTGPVPMTGVPPQQPEQQIVPAPVSAIVASSADIALLTETARLAKVEAQVEADKLTVTEQQLEATENQFKLREAQFKARSMVQNERIEDLEQQLSSLYVAFEMLRQEHSEDEVTRAALQTSLNEADSRVAQQVNEHDRARRVEAYPVAASPDVVRSSTPSPPPVTPQYATASPVIPPSAGASSQSSQISTPIGPHAIVSSQSSQALREDSIVMSGVLLVKGSNIIRQWKKKHATLYQNVSNFQLVISDVTSTKPDKTYVIEVGVSTLNRYATQRHAFIIRVNPYDKEAPVIFAAAQTETDYQQWMSALKLATTGDEYNPHDYNVGFGESHMLASNVDDQEASDLQMALRRSTQEM